MTPTPAIVVNFRSFSTGCADPTTCGVEVADTALQQGQGMHGSFSRADTRNTMGAAGPSFRQKFESTAPASNADLGKTIVHLMGLKVAGQGQAGRAACSPRRCPTAADADGAVATCCVRNPTLSAT